MTLHENLERKRRLNISGLKKSGACHLCECTGTRSIQRFIGKDDDDTDTYNDVNNHEEMQDGDGDDADDVDSSPSNLPMRTCMCYGNTTSWPYPLKVCEMCVADDATTGRIRSCGICGVVACDEDCGVELVEATDRDEMFNAGCLECRQMESFSEMELFRRRPYPNGIPRATRVCKGCVELFSLFSFGIKYHFKCPKFKCKTLLVHSDVIELKRKMKPFPLSLLPEELLDSIVDFLGGKDLFSFGMVSTFMFRKVENVSMSIVTRFNHQLPTGPTHFVTNKTDPKRMIVTADGKNRHNLRPPDDGKTWVGILNQMEYLTRDIYYFDFQVKGGDDGAAMRYLRRGDKLAFDRIYSKPSGTGAITPYFDTSGFSMRGGQVLVLRYKWDHRSRLEILEDRNNRHENVRSIIFSTDKTLDSGIHRAIIRFSCFCEGDTLGTIGLLRHQRDGSSVAWAYSHNINYHGRMEEHVFGAEYDADKRTFLIYKKNNKTNKMEATPSGSPVAIADEGGKLCLAVALSSHSIGVKNNQLSIRACKADEWSDFLAHTAEKNTIPRMRTRSRRGEAMRFLARRDEMAGRDGHENMMAAHEEMMDMLLEEEMEHEVFGMDNSDSDEEDDNMNVENVAPNLAGVPNLPGAPNLADAPVLVPRADVVEDP